MPCANTAPRADGIALGAMPCVPMGGKILDSDTKIPRRAHRWRIVVGNNFDLRGGGNGLRAAMALWFVWDT